MLEIPSSGHRWATITPNDHSGAVYIVTFLGFTYTSLTFLTRVFIKWQLLGLDDAAMLIAQATNIIQFALLLASLSAGLAKSFASLSDEQYVQMASTFASGQITIYISLGFSKLSAILLVQRLFISEMKKAWTTCNAIIGSIIIWTIMSTLLVSVDCSPPSLSPKTPSDICSGIETRYLFVIITDALTDLILAVVPTYLIRNLQMSTHFKLQVLGIFAVRLPLILLAGLFYKAWHLSLYSEDHGVTRTYALVLQQCQVCFSIIASTIPCLKSFIQSFDTGSGVKPGFGYSSKSSGRYGHVSTIHHSAVVSADRDEAYQLATLNFARNRSIRIKEAEERDTAIRVNRRPSPIEEDRTTSSKSVELERRSSQRSTDQLFIRKDIEWTVKHESAGEDAGSYKPGLLRLPK